MESDPSTYTLNAWELDQALAILQREQQAHTPSARQAKTFKLLYRAIYLFVIVLDLLVVAGPFITKSTKITDVTGMLIIVASFSGLSGLAVGSLTLFLLNLPYMSGLLRQRKLARQLGLWEALRLPWRTERRQNKLRNVLDLGLFILGLHFAWVVLRNPPLIIRHGNLAGVLVISVGFVIIGVMIATIFVRRSQARLELVCHLSSSLEGYKEEVKQDKDGHIHLPTEDYEKIAQIERAQITRGRVQSIMSGLDKAGASPYVVQKSHPAQQAQAKLDTTTRLRVQDQIDALTTAPHPAGITGDPKAGTFHLRVPETPVIIGFTVDDRARCVQILSVESPSAAAESSSEPGKE